MTNDRRIKRPVTTTETSFEIVQHLLETRGATITQLSDELDLAESTVYRHIATLEEHDFVTKIDGMYRVGLRFLETGVAEQNNRPLYQAGSEPVDQLSSSVGKRAWLSSFENGCSVTLHWASDAEPLHQYSQVGQRNPPTIAASGKAMLSQLPEDAVSEIIETDGLPAETDRSITDPDELFDELRETRERGFAVSKGESFRGVEAIAAPIRVREPDVLGAVGIGRSVNQGDDTLEQQFAETLLETAGEIAVQLRNHEYAD